MPVALEGGEWSAARPSRTLHGTHCTGGWVGLRAGLEGRKFSPHRDFFNITMALLNLIQFVQCLVYTAVLTTLDLS